MNKKETQLLLEIHTDVAIIKEHLKEQNSKVFENKTDIKTIKDRMPTINVWNKLLTITVTILAGACGYLFRLVLDLGGG